jgi:hypothetical protein
MKPVFILFNGFGSSHLWWEYDYKQNKKLKKLDFLKNIELMGDTFIFNYTFFNFNFYYKGDNKEEKKINKMLNNKYKMFSSDIDFTLEDLDFRNICEQVYKSVIQKYGLGRKYILICHSFGCYIGALFSKLYKNDCLLNIFINNPPFIEKIIKEQINSEEGKKEKATVRKYFKTNEQLIDILSKVKKSNDPNKYIKLLYDLVSYYSEKNKLNYFTTKMSVQTVFFKAYHTDPKEKYQKEWNKLLLQEKDKNKQSHTKYIIFLDADHYIWKNQTYSNDIIEEIINQLRRILL